METHANHLHHAPGKKLRHYFFEFLMLFLAVSAGFYAENIRESRNERKRERQYVKMLMEDLKSDTVILNYLSGKRSRQVAVYDSLYLLLNRPDRNKIGDTLYKYAKESMTFFFYTGSDRTLTQLNNSGSMRLIENPVVADSIASFDIGMQTTKGRSDDAIIRQHDYKLKLFKVFDNRIFYASDIGGIDSLFLDRKIEGNPQILSNDPNDINELIGLLRSLKAGNNISRMFEQLLLKQENDLMAMLQKEYHIN